MTNQLEINLLLIKIACAVISGLISYFTLRFRDKNRFESVKKNILTITFVLSGMFSLAMTHSVVHDAYMAAHANAQIERQNWFNGNF